MKLTTKRNRWYFWRELFSYMIPMILIVGTIDVFISFMRCPLHPEWSAPCSINWIIAIIYWIFLVLAIILAVISAKMLRKIKKRIEDDFLESSNYRWNEKNKKTDKSNWNKEEIFEDIKIEKKVNPKKIIVNADSNLKENKKSTDSKKFLKKVAKKQ